MNCKICGSVTSKKLTSFIFEKGFDIDYYQCPNCGFVQTQEPTWLDRAYSDAIAPLDIGLLERNKTFSNLTEKLLLTFYPGAKTFVDFGSGYGVFVRMMRDKGFDFKWNDAHCENLFAKHFEEPDLNKKTDVITAFEVMEHLPNPVSQIGDLVKNSQVFIFSTDITHEQQPDFNEWWYRAPYSGQHVSFYTFKSLAIMAKKFGRHFYTNGTTYHLFSVKELNEKEVKEFFYPTTSLLHKIGTKLISMSSKKHQPKETLLHKDHAYLTELYRK